MENEFVVFENGELKLDVSITPDKDTVWLTLEQMAKLYDKDRSTVGAHIRNIYKEGELDEKTSGGISPRSKGVKNRPPRIYNLDVIISVGYRVKSNRGIVFRKWASSILKDYMMKGYALNERRLEALHKTVHIQSNIIAGIAGIDAEDVLKVVEEYMNALSLLDDYDHRCINRPQGTKCFYQLSYEQCCELVHKMSFQTDVFGVEKEVGKVEGILSAVYQDVFGIEIYPTLEEKAANLLYFLIKDHPYVDGCKRIAAAIFLEFLHKNNALFQNHQKIISDSALVAITLMIAESRPEEKEIMISLVMNFLYLPLS